jgi:DNA-binding NarL/FixJ family response regulator
MSDPAPLARGRSAYRNGQWRHAVSELSAADREAPLGTKDLESLATAAFLVGRTDDSNDAWTRAHRACLDRGDMPRAARCAFWLGFQLVNSGEQAQGFGWIARAGRLLEGVEHDCVERGYVLMAEATQAIFGGDAETARGKFERAATVGDRFDEPDLVALARQGQGRALIRQGSTGSGMRLLDEVMVAVTAGEVSPLVSGDVYCSVIEACHEVFDLRRAAEWTVALSRWCENQPDIVPYRGNCLVRRSEIMQLHGKWASALDEAVQACERLSDPPGQPALGAAFYQLAEMHRLRGEFADAEDAYANANRYGLNPQPGLAQLRLAQGRSDLALASIRPAVERSRSPNVRARLLAVYCEILLAADEPAAARVAVGELEDIADALDAPLARALFAQSIGCVLLTEGDLRAGLESLQGARALWLELAAPYEAARVRVRIARACRALGDRDTERMETEAARATFEELGAAPEIERLSALSKGERGTAGGLTRRETEVIRLVSTGRTNRQIAEELFISEKTVARHISNIFRKLGLSTRAAATAYAYEHDLV